MRPIVIVRWAAVVAWAVVIVFLSANTSTNLSSDLGLFSEFVRGIRSVERALFGPNVDVLSPMGHFFEYLVLSILLVNALWQHMPLKRACLVAIVCCSLFGALDEIHQYFVPERMCDPLDWLVDTIAATVGALIGYPLLKRVDAYNARRAAAKAARHVGNGDRAATIEAAEGGSTVDSERSNNNDKNP